MITTQKLIHPKMGLLQAGLNSSGFYSDENEAPVSPAAIYIKATSGLYRTHVYLFISNVALIKTTCLEQGWRLGA
ncbi:hypothetical protein [Parafilimonas sp.]|uniref:hypothetical protein n=1 Tax=Parafilimonas sp. TaxID=1969739 RepID=UPI0039E2F4E7